MDDGLKIKLLSAKEIVEIIQKESWKKLGIIIDESVVDSYKKLYLKRVANKESRKIINKFFIDIPKREDVSRFQNPVELNDILPLWDILISQFDEKSRISSIYKQNNIIVGTNFIQDLNSSTYKGQDGSYAIMLNSYFRIWSITVSRLIRTLLVSVVKGKYVTHHHPSPLFSENLKLIDSSISEFVKFLIEYISSFEVPPTNQTFIAKDSETYTIDNIMHSGSISFVLLHEIGHINLNHLDYRQNDHTFQRYRKESTKNIHYLVNNTNEFKNLSSKDIDTLLVKADSFLMEIHSDLYAIDYARSIFSTKFIDFPKEHHLRKGISFMDDMSFATFWFLGIHSFLWSQCLLDRCLETIITGNYQQLKSRNIMIDLIENKTYPSPRTRLRTLEKDNEISRDIIKMLTDIEESIYPIFAEYILKEKVQYVNEFWLKNRELKVANK